MNEPTPILVSNSFPFALVRRPMHVRPRSLEVLRALLKVHPLHSAWGHGNTLAAAMDFLGHDLTPACERPALTLSADGLPMLDNVVFTDCWLLSPNYPAGYRPRINEEVPCDRILGWQVLHLHWPPLEETRSGRR